MSKVNSKSGKSMKGAVKPSKKEPKIGNVGIVMKEAMKKKGKVEPTLPSTSIGQPVSKEKMKELAARAYKSAQSKYDAVKVTASSTAEINKSEREAAEHAKKNGKKKVTIEKSLKPSSSFKYFGADDDKAKGWKPVEGRTNAFDAFVFDLYDNEEFFLTGHVVFDEKQYDLRDFKKIRKPGTSTVISYEQTFEYEGSGITVTLILHND